MQISTDRVHPYTESILRRIWNLSNVIIKIDAFSINSKIQLKEEFSKRPDPFSVIF